MPDKPGRRVAQPPRWKSLLVEVVILIVGFSFIGYAWLFYTTPNVFPPATHDELLTVRYPNDSTIVQSSNGVKYTVLTPTVHFEIQTTFEAKGGYGAGNPITIHALITHANATLTDFYCCLFFTGASSPNPSLYEAGWLNLTKIDSQTYTADGVLEWATGGPTYTWLYPNAPIPSPGTSLQTYWGVGMDVITLKGIRTDPTLTIDPLADTQAWQNAQLSTQISITGIGIAIIGPYEFLKRVVNP